MSNHIKGKKTQKLNQLVYYKSNIVYNLVHLYNLYGTIQWNAFIFYGTIAFMTRYVCRLML